MHQKKYRNQLGLFFVEGKKACEEFFDSRFELLNVYATDVELFEDKKVKVEQISEQDLKKISALTTPNMVLAVFKIPKVKPINTDDWVLAVDDVRDPGNLGTIIRLCDWFGIANLVCSTGTVDCYNPKTVQATMGSLGRINVGYTNLYEFLKRAEQPVCGAFMDGSNLYQTSLPKKGILVMGNEANGISSEIEQLITQKLSIPQFGEPTTESLNVATATAILLSEIRRG